MDDRAAMIRAARAWLGMGQAELAEAAGLALPTIQRAERGGPVTDKSWRRITEVTAGRGLELDEDACALRRVA